MGYKTKREIADAEQIIINSNIVILKISEHCNRFWIWFNINFKSVFSLIKEKFKSYFIEYPTQQDADTKFNEFYTQLITKQTTPQQSGSTTTTTTLKPGTTPSVSGSTNNSGDGNNELSRDELIGYMAKNLDQMGVGKKWHLIL